MVCAFKRLSLAIISHFFFSSRRRHTRWPRDWSSDVCSSDLNSGTGPSTSAFFITSSIGKLFIGEGGIFISLIHSTNCFVELAYTMRPNPTHPWAAEHMAQCSPDV